MIAFLDSSVLIAACASPTGGSAAVIALAPECGWRLIASDYVHGEVERHMSKLGPAAASRWADLRERIGTVADVLTHEHPVVFVVSKDRPILFTASAWADVLLTLDRRDFLRLLGDRFYRLDMMTPGEFLVTFEIDTSGFRS